MSFETLVETTKCFPIIQCILSETRKLGLNKTFANKLTGKIRPWIASQVNNTVAK